MHLSHRHIWQSCQHGWFTLWRHLGRKFLQNLCLCVQMIHPQTTDAVPSFGGGTSNTNHAYRQFGSDLVLTPAQLVEGLSGYIVGQDDAKRVGQRYTATTLCRLEHI